LRFKIPSIPNFKIARRRNELLAGSPGTRGFQIANLRFDIPTRGFKIPNIPNFEISRRRQQLLNSLQGAFSPIQTEAFLAKLPKRQDKVGKKIESAPDQHKAKLEPLAGFVAGSCRASA
jgi:hypothetical protein